MNIVNRRLNKNTVIRDWIREEKINIIRNEEKTVTTDTDEIKKIIREYYKQHYICDQKTLIKWVIWTQNSLEPIQEFSWDFWSAMVTQEAGNRRLLV